VARGFDIVFEPEDSDSDFEIVFEPFYEFKTEARCPKCDGKFIPPTCVDCGFSMFASATKPLH
jgi:predicted Zn-ribbon and HTH transcriptional regulator